MQKSEAGTVSKARPTGVGGGDRMVERRSRPDNESETIQIMLAEKIALMEENTQKIATRDSQIFHLKGVIKQKQMEVQRLESQIQLLKGNIDDKDNQADSVVQQLNEQINELNKELDENDVFIEELESLIGRCLDKVKALVGSTREAQFQLNDSNESLNFNSFMKDLHNSEQSIMEQSGVLRVSKRNSRLESMSLEATAKGSQLWNLVCSLENKMRTDREVLLKKQSDCLRLGSQLSIMAGSVEEQQKIAKLLKEKLDVAERDVARFKEKQKMLEEIYKKSEESRSVLLREIQQNVAKAMSKDPGSQKSIDQMRTAKRHLQQKVEDLEKKVQTLMNENMQLRSDSTRQNQEMISNMRKLQKNFDDRLHQKEMEIRNTMRQSR